MATSTLNSVESVEQWIRFNELPNCTIKHDSGGGKIADINTDNVEDNVEKVREVLNIFQGGRLRINCSNNQSGGAAGKNAYVAVVSLPGKTQGNQAIGSVGYQNGAAMPQVGYTEDQVREREQRAKEEQELRDKVKDLEEALNTPNGVGDKIGEVLEKALTPDVINNILTFAAASFGSHAGSQMTQQQPVNGVQEKETPSQTDIMGQNQNQEENQEPYSQDQALEGLRNVKDGTPDDVMNVAESVLAQEIGGEQQLAEALRQLALMSIRDPQTFNFLVGQLKNKADE